mmetsp:Transcript_22620/g.38352  ORF Transcript_22620/g.38352 Transcript_22620/m.38352 type:complete len:416 (-) Transcript_22620:4542-5789(-)
MIEHEAADNAQRAVEQQQQQQQEPQVVVGKAAVLQLCGALAQRRRTGRQLRAHHTAGVVAEVRALAIHHAVVVRRRAAAALRERTAVKVGAHAARRRNVGVGQQLFELWLQRERELERRVAKRRLVHFELLAVRVKQRQFVDGVERADARRTNRPAIDLAANRQLLEADFALLDGARLEQVFKQLAGQREARAWTAQHCGRRARRRLLHGPHEVGLIVVGGARKLLLPRRLAWQHEAQRHRAERVDGVAQRVGVRRVVKQFDRRVGNHSAGQTDGVAWRAARDAERERSGGHFVEPLDHGHVRVELDRARRERFAEQLEFRVGSGRRQFGDKRARDGEHKLVAQTIETRLLHGRVGVFVVFFDDLTFARRRRGGVLLGALCLEFEDLRENVGCVEELVGIAVAFGVAQLLFKRRQ